VGNGRYGGEKEDCAVVLGTTCRVIPLKHRGGKRSQGPCHVGIQEKGATNVCSGTELDEKETKKVEGYNGGFTSNR